VIPSTPTGLRENPALRTVNAFGIQWGTGFNNGAAGVTYSMFAQYVDARGQPQQLTLQGLTDTSFLADELVTGAEYTITIQASNICGASDRSLPLVLTAGTTPGAPCPVSTTYNSVSDEVQCTWGQSVNNGFQVSAYKVFIRDASNTFRNVANLCKESTQQQQQQQ
jgi:hypothetical protein